MPGGTSGVRNSQGCVMKPGHGVFGKTNDRPNVVFSAPIDSPGRLLRDAHVRMRAELVRAFHDEGFDLSPEQWGVFSLLGYSKSLSQLEIGRSLGKDRHQTSRLIDALEERGYVVRTPSTEDRRVKRIALSDAGRDTLPKIVRLLSERLGAIFQGVTQQEYDAFVKCLRHIVSRPLPDGSPEES